MNMEPVRIEKPKSLSQVVAEEVKEAILKGIFQPGDKLVETNLTQSLGVSRTPLREAFRELAAEGYITVIPHKGAYVSRITREEAYDLYIITSVLEGLATRLATPHLCEGKAREEFLSLYEDLKAQHKKGNVDAYWAANRHFHQFIADASGNERLQGIIDNLRRQILKTRVITLNYPGRLDESMAEHEEILQAILREDGREAERLVIDHLEKQSRFVLDLLPPEPEEE
ncbi:MAG: GntR family transcriptional regulator [bacterium]|nr:GntR family transcriptional regulator [bacterium]